MAEEILQINENFSVDESIEKYEYYEHYPTSGETNLNNGNEIRIVIETQDLFTHPSESFLMIEGKLTKRDGTEFAAADNITLVNNGIMHLFQYMTYELSGQEIEKVNYLGQATTMKGILTYPCDYAKKGMNSCWITDTIDEAGLATRIKLLLADPSSPGSFSFCIPLKHIFGFAEDYNKVIYGFKHQLSLFRKSTDNDALFKDVDAALGKITLRKVVWFMPQVRPADMAKLPLYKIIESKAKLSVGFRTRQCDSITVPQSTNFSWRLSVKASPEKPRWIIIGFQTDRDSDQTKNTSCFDNLDLKSIHVTLNTRRYPAIDYNIAFKNNNFSRVYRDAAEFRPNYYRMDDLVSNFNISTMEYKELYPLFVFDVSKQSERLKNSVTDILVKATFNTIVPDKTEAYALVISDKIISFDSDGNKMNVVV